MKQTGNDVDIFDFLLALLFVLMKDSHKLPWAAHPLLCSFSYGLTSLPTAFVSGPTLFSPE